MKRTDELISKPPAPAPCDRADLRDWSARGGPLPPRLADHTRVCRGCAERVRRAANVHASLSLLGTQTPPAGLRARANGRALRFLRRAARASEAARQLLAMKPELTPWQRAQLHIARVSLSAAATFLLLLAHAGLMTGIERTRAMGQQLADLHWQRHIDPDGEWLDPPHLS